MADLPAGLPAVGGQAGALAQYFNVFCICSKKFIKKVFICWINQ